MIAEESQKLEPSALIELFKLDISGIAPELPTEDQTVYFCAMKNELGEAVTWQSQAYAPYPIEATGFDVNAQGSPPRPILRAANIDGVLTELCLAYQDLVKAKLTRYRTFARFLDAVNFADGNPDADPDQYFPPDVYYIERKTKENDVLIEWEMRWSFDLQGVVLPGRIIADNTCPWEYKSAECSWVPVSGKYFDVNDESTTLGNDECSHKLTGCEKRFGRKNVLPFGGFPGAGSVRQ